jgi:Uma2 family endonuclease
MASVVPKLLTAEEFAQLPEPADGSREELVRGVVITMPPPRFRHGYVQLRTGSLLDQYVRPLRLGRVIAETGVITERDPDSVRGPDVAYWSAERLPLDVVPDLYPEVAADLCVEVLSPGETADKVDEYFAAGVRLVWYVDPAARTVTVYRPGQPARLLTEADTLAGEDVVPGFQCRVAELFA